MFSANMSGIIWVVDATDTLRLEESKQLLNQLLGNLVRVVPVLILCNKFDKPSAKPLAEIAAAFGDEIRAESCSVMGCSAFSGQGVVESLDWLCDQLDASTSEQGIQYESTRTGDNDDVVL